MTNIQVSRSFSTGQFSNILNQLSETIIWDIIGQQKLVGLEAVTQYCLQIQNYFDTTTHCFNILKEIQQGNICIIQGTAEFSSSNVITKISACDIYTFDSSHILIHIESYCINLPQLIQN